MAKIPGAVTPPFVKKKKELIALQVANNFVVRAISRAIPA